MSEEKTKFKLFTISYELKQETKVDFIELCNKVIAIASDPTWWIYDNKFRYTLIKCDTVSDNIIYGYIAQQHTLEQHLYDDIKHSTDNKIESYEDRFFVLDLYSHKLSLEWRQFRNKPPLSLQLTVNRIHKIIVEAFALIELPVKVNLQPVDFSTTKQEFIDIFYSNRILEIHVDEFGKSPVSSNVRLVNPNIHLEDAAREMIDHDVLHPSISRMLLEAKPDGSGNLKSSIIARAAIHSGQPLSLKYQAPSGNIYIRRKTEKGEFEINFPIDTTEPISERRKVAIKILQEVSKLDLRQDNPINYTSQIGLFDSQGDYGEK